MTQIPIIINNRNRLEYLSMLIHQLESRGYKNIYIIDNGSTYDPLLKYYKQSPYKIFYLEENIGYMALWKTGIYKQFRHSYYVYTDPDVVPVKECPQNFISKLWEILLKYPQIEKIGLGLKIDDIPDHYAFKQEVIKAELAYWQKTVAKDVYDAPVDTTFALYKPYAKGNAEQCPAYRTGAELQAHHLPWYENSAALSEESLYYKAHIKKGTSVWSQK